MQGFKDEIQDLLKVATGLKEIPLETPPNPAMGDFALACFTLAKTKKKSPGELAKELADELPESPIIDRIEAAGPYLNIFLNKPKIAERILSTVHERKDEFGKKPKIGKTVVIDYSSPNIAKPFGVHHLRTTVIGSALIKLYEAAGYDTVGVNHLGDWGTQFGKLMVAFKLWGDEGKLEADPIHYLLNLYVKFHEEEQKNEKLTEEAREWFKRLEAADPEALRLWESFRELSLREFQRVYDLMNVRFDSFHGEAFYQDKIDDVIERIKRAGLAVESDGALIVDLSDINTPPLMLLKSNGTSTYHTRDLAAALYRIKEYSPEKVLYVVDYAQTLHFKQLFTVLDMLEYGLAQFEHVSFGRMQFAEGQFSTRKGNVVFLEDVLDKAIKLAEDIIESKNPHLANKELVAKWIGVGAIIWNDLINDRIKDVMFTWERVLDFEGETGPYVQYTHARACSILRKTGVRANAKVDFTQFKHAAEHNLIMHLTRYENAIEESIKTNKPHHMARYILVLAQLFNEFYHQCPVLQDDASLQEARVLLVSCVAQVMKNALSLIGMHAPEEM